MATCIHMSSAPTPRLDILSVLEPFLSPKDRIALTIAMTKSREGRVKGVKWDMVSVGHFEDRCGYCMTVVPDEDGYRLLLVGGYGLTDVLASDDGGEVWWVLHECAPFGVIADHAMVTVPFGNTIVMTGGFDGDKCFSDVWWGEDKGSEWEQISTNMECGDRQCHAMCVLPETNDILLVGGFKNKKIMSDCWQSDDMGESWECVCEEAEWGKIRACVSNRKRHNVHRSMVKF